MLKLFQILIIFSFLDTVQKLRFRYITKKVIIRKINIKLHLSHWTFDAAYSALLKIVVIQYKRPTIGQYTFYHWSITMCTGLLLVIFISTMSCYKTCLLFSLITFIGRQSGIYFGDWNCITLAMHGRGYVFWWWIDVRTYSYYEVATVQNAKKLLFIASSYRQLFEDIKMKN